MISAEAKFQIEPPDCSLHPNPLEDVTAQTRQRGQEIFYDHSDHSSDGNWPLPSQISKLLSQISKLPRRISKLPRQISRLPSQISKLSSQSSKLPSQIFKLPSQITKLQSQIMKLQSQISKLLSQISNKQKFQIAKISYHHHHHFYLGHICDGVGIVHQLPLIHLYFSQPGKKGFSFCFKQLFICLFVPFKTVIYLFVLLKMCTLTSRNKVCDKA